MKLANAEIRIALTLLSSVIGYNIIKVLLHDRGYGGESAWLLSHDLHFSSAVDRVDGIGGHYRDGGEVTIIHLYIEDSESLLL